ncbi:hypothetical protein [Mesorhizobium sp. SP-1A]|uniref:hypothetical protein n=1 Tax=Mesorhizobium sp. SP-1A TaxID=3077840 RepID=UPI0028F7147D|nr:hypothetical protein [Mesorhizobium sp. SP-1A]
MLQFVARPETVAAAHAAIRAERDKKLSRRRPLSERLADAMLEITGAGQIVDRNALALRGFLRSELTDDKLAEARDLANARAIRNVA